MKNRSSNNKINIKEEASSGRAIAIYILSSIGVGVAVFLLFALIIKILKLIPQKNIAIALIDILDFKYFDILFKLFLVLLYVLVFSIILKKKIKLQDSKDFMQKFSVVILIFAYLGTFINLQISKSELHTQFLTLLALQPTYYKLVEADPESEFYKTHYETEVIGEFSDEGDVREGFLNKYDEAVDYYVYSQCEAILIGAVFEILCMAVCIKAIDKKECV